MLTTMLDRLGSLLSRQFIISYYVPVLVFAFLNAMLLAWQIPAFRAWAPAQFEGLKGFYALPVLICLAVIAYLMFSVNVYLRHVLEGRRLPSKEIVVDWSRLQAERRGRMMNRYRAARNAFFTLQAEKAGWRQRLIDAADAGHATKVLAVYPAGGTTRLSAGLANRRDNLELLPVADIQNEITALEAILRAMDAKGPHADAQHLRSDYREMLAIFDDAEAAWGIERNIALHDLHANFGTEQPLPTRMGNIAAALDSYADTRYRMNLAIFWSRMQPLLQADKEFYGSLIDAKCQLDFLVMCCWLCVLTTILWLFAMPWFQFSWPLFPIVFAVVPLLARAFYVLAVENYAVMTEIIKSGVDLFRFRLLKTLHVPLPSGLRQERVLWTALSALAEEGLEISYQHEGVP